MSVRSPLINVMVQAAYKAGRNLIHDFGEVQHLQVSLKGPGDFVTAADKRTEKILRQELHKARPNYGFLCEESGEQIGENPDMRWIIDPLDGTTNFLHSIPHFAISIGLEKEGFMIAGVIYDPVKDELFWAEKGRGAYVNDRRMRVSSRKKLDISLIATGIPFGTHGNADEFSDHVKKIAPQVAGIRRMGAASLDLAYVAAGRYEGFWETHLYPWDVAAGMLMIVEAGGKITQCDGQPYKLGDYSILASNMGLHQPLVEMFA